MTEEEKMKTVIDHINYCHKIQREVNQEINRETRRALYITLIGIGSLYIVGLLIIGIIFGFK